MQRHVHFFKAASVTYFLSKLMFLIKLKICRPTTVITKGLDRKVEVTVPKSRREEGKFPEF